MGVNKIMIWKPWGNKWRGIFCFIDLKNNPYAILCYLPTPLLTRQDDLRGKVKTPSITQHNFLLEQSHKEKNLPSKLHNFSLAANMKVTAVCTQKTHLDHKTHFSREKKGVNQGDAWTRPGEGSRESSGPEENHISACKSVDQSHAALNNECRCQ